MSYVLVVEDSLTNADIAIRLLETLKLEVHHVTRGLEGAKLARAEHPILILMDFNLPDIDGRTLVLLLRKQLGGNLAPPMVAMTARTGDLEERIAARFGCSAFISKPFEPEAFLDIVKSLIPAHRMTQKKRLMMGFPK